MLETVLIAVFGTLGGIMLSLFLFSVVCFFKFLYKNDDKLLDEVELKGTHYEPYIDRLYEAIGRMRKEEFEKVSIKSGNKTLVGRYFNRGGSKTAIMVHGFHSTPYNSFSTLAGKLLDKGYNVLFIYQRGTGESDGKMATMGLREKKDILKWVDFAASDEKVTDILLYGVSMGGSAIGFASDEIKCEKVKVLAIDCAYNSPMSQLVTFLKNPKRKPLAIILPFVWIDGLLFLGINLAKSILPHLAKCKIPTCFVHGEKDHIVPISHSEKSFEVCNCDKKFISVKDAGHTAGMLVGGDEKINEFFDFVEKYIK